MHWRRLRPTTCAAMRSKQLHITSIISSCGFNAGAPSSSSCWPGPSQPPPSLTRPSASARPQSPASGAARRPPGQTPGRPAGSAPRRRPSRPGGAARGSRRGVIQQRMRARAASEQRALACRHGHGNDARSHGCAARTCPASSSPGSGVRGPKPSPPAAMKRAGVASRPYAAPAGQRAKCSVLSGVDTSACDTRPGRPGKSSPAEGVVCGRATSQAHASSPQQVGCTHASARARMPSPLAQLARVCVARALDPSYALCTRTRSPSWPSSRSCSCPLRSSYSGPRAFQSVPAQRLNHSGDAGTPTCVTPGRAAGRAAGGAARAAR